MSKTKTSKGKHPNAGLIKRFKQNAKHEDSLVSSFVSQRFYFSAAASAGRSAVWKKAAKIVEELS